MITIRKVKALRQYTITSVKFERRKKKNRQRVRGVAKKGTKAKEDEENKEDDCENEEGGHAYKESDEEDEVDPFSIQKKEEILKTI